LVGRGHGLILRYYPSIHLEGLRKSIKNLDQYSQSLGLRIEPGTSRIGSRSVNHSTMTFGEDNINMYLSEIGWQVVDLINLAQDMDQ
jgi:hypothetical protein